jgi:hypothetical protein
MKFSGHKVSCSVNIMILVCMEYVVLCLHVAITAVQQHVNCYLKVSCDSSCAICKVLPPYALNNSSSAICKTLSVSVQNDTCSAICTVLPPHVLNDCSSAICVALPPHVLNDSASAICKVLLLCILNYPSLAVCPNWHSELINTHTQLWDISKFIFTFLQ